MNKSARYAMMTTAIALVLTGQVSSQTGVTAKEPKVHRLHAAVLYADDGTRTDSLTFRYGPNGQVVEMVKRSAINVEFFGIEYADRTVKYRRFADPEKKIELSTVSYVYNTDGTIKSLELNYLPPGEQPPKDAIIIRDSTS